MNSTVKDVMTTHVLWVRRDATYKQMAARLRQYRISAFPVLDEDLTVIGVVSEADLLLKEGLDDEDGLAAMMYSRGLKRLPVVNTAGQLADIISPTDVLAVFDRPGAEIRVEITSIGALPAEWRQRWTLRRYGFHGLSHAYVSRRAAELVPGGAFRIVSCHLGAGASLCAIRDGRSVDTTMGYTPLDGLVMATRSGSIDPGLMLWLETHAGMPSGELASTLEHRSGMLGLAGTADMREILSRAATGDAHAVLARDVYLHRLVASVASMAAALGGLGGLDVLAFTGGVGENSAEIRSRVMDGLGFLGVRGDAGHNEAGARDREIGAPGAPARSMIISAREDLEIARQVHSVLNG